MFVTVLGLKLNLTRADINVLRRTQEVSVDYTPKDVLVEEQDAVVIKLLEGGYAEVCSYHHGGEILKAHSAELEKIREALR